MSATTLAMLALSAAFAGQAPARDEPATTKGVSDERVAFMRGSLAPIRLSVAGGGARLRLKDEPVFRMGNQPADIVKEGAIFFWVDEVGRPAAAVQVFQVVDAGAPNGLWLHEFVSLSPNALDGQGGGPRTWSPQAPGVELKPVPGAPRPAETAAQRDRQIRAMAREFHATDFFHKKSWTDLRLLPTPVARYGKPGAAVADGAAFAFVTGTDPEAFLFLEAREGKAGPEWQYAFAPMTCWELKGSHRTQNVWTATLREGASDPSRPYYVQPLFGLSNP